MSLVRVKHYYSGEHSTPHLIETTTRTLRRPNANRSGNGEPFGLTDRMRDAGVHNFNALTFGPGQWSVTPIEKNIRVAMTIAGAAGQNSEIIDGFGGEGGMGNIFFIMRKDVEYMFFVGRSGGPDPESNLFRSENSPGGGRRGSDIEQRFKSNGGGGTFVYKGGKLIAVAGGGGGAGGGLARAENAGNRGVLNRSASAIQRGGFGGGPGKSGGVGGGARGGYGAWTTRLGGGTFYSDLYGYQTGSGFNKDQEVYPLSEGFQRSGDCNQYIGSSTKEGATNVEGVCSCSYNDANQPLRGVGSESCSTFGTYEI